MKNIFYFRNIGEIGGIETFLYYLAQKYRDYDITIIYEEANKEQLKRLKKYVKCVRYVGQNIECEKAFFNYNLEIIDKVKAKEYYQIIHGDYKSTNIKPNTNPKITKYLGVSEIACNSFEELTGEKAICIYNPISVDKPKRILKLISATRLSGEKGYNRMVKLAQELIKNNIPFEWKVFSNAKNINNDYFILRRAKLDIISDIAEADYLVQLSDSEGYCYSIVESLSVGTPVICTDIPVLEEIGVNKNNSYILNMDMSNIDTNKIYKEIPKVANYKAPKCVLIDYIDKTKSNYEEEKEMKYKVKALDTYEKKNIIDGKLNKIPKAGEIFEVDKERLEVLLGDNAYNMQFVTVVQKIEKVETATKKVVTEKAARVTTKKTK